MCGLASAPIMRRVISSPSMRSFECTLATTTSRRASRSGSWSKLPFSRISTSMPVSIWNGANFSLSASTTLSCSRNRSGLSPFAIVNRGEWSVRAM